MGKYAQQRQGNGGPDEKTNPSFKWARMLHLLDYHRWHYVKKVLAHKKHSDGRRNIEGNSNILDASETQTCEQRKIIQPLKLKEKTTDANISAKSSMLPSSPRNKSCSAGPSSPPTKSSRAARIRRMITKEVTKRRSRHRRSSTCPAGDLVTNDAISPRSGTTSEGLIAKTIESDEIPNKIIDDSDKNCELCSTMQIECQLGDKKQVGEQGDQQLNHMNMLLQKISDEAINHLSNDKTIETSASFEHSKELLDAMDVLSMNKQFFLRILDDPGSSLRHHFLAQQAATSTKRKSLTKSGTFPMNDHSGVKDASPGLFKQNKKSYFKQNSSTHVRSEKPSTTHDNRVVGRRFKDLRHKIKHVIKESRKERRRIAMDAVLHKVPYGQKVLEESTKESPRVSTCESDFSCSSSSSKGGHNRKIRSPSLDEYSLDRYCQLFETTSCNKEAKIDTPQRSRLRVMEDNSFRKAEKGLGRIFSSPDLQAFLSHQSEDSNAHTSFRRPNKRIMSFNDANIQSDLNVDVGGTKKYGALDESTTNENLDDHIELYSTNSNNEVWKSNVNDERVTTEAQNYKNIEDSIYLEESSLDNNNDNDTVTSTQPTSIEIIELVPTSTIDLDLHKVPTSVPEMTLQDNGPIQKEELLNESPTFACKKVDDDQVESPHKPLSPIHRHVRVASKDEAEFNYVKDILQLSGYTGTQLLGTWYSSEQPVDPSVFVELESCSLIEPENSPSKESTHNNHLLLFDLINEILLAIYERSVSYWYAPLSSCCRTHPMPKGYHVLDEVWACIHWYMGCSKLEFNASLDYVTMRDLAKNDEWMNLQFDVECVGLEVEDLIFEDLLSELVS